MSAIHRQQSCYLTQQLIQAPYTFEFHQAVRILQSWHGIAALSDTHFGDGLENFQFSCPVHYASSPSDITNITIPQLCTSAYRLQINFFGISGVHGTLPPPFGDLIAERSVHTDDTLQDFMDIFNHRLLTLLHKIRQKYWPGLTINEATQHPYASVLFSLCGVANNPLPSKNEFTKTLISYTNLFWQEQRSLSGLQRLIQSYFGYKIECQAWNAQWCHLDEVQYTRLGRQNQALGINTTLGIHTWQQNCGFIIRIHVDNYSEFQSLLPTGSAFHILQNIIQIYCGIHYDVRLHLILDPKDIPTSHLNQTFQLGWTTYLQQPNQQQFSSVSLWLNI